MGRETTRIRAFAIFAVALLATAGTVAAIESNDDGVPAQPSSGRPRDSAESGPTRSQSPDRWVDTELTPARWQSPDTWVDTELTPTRGELGLTVPDPLGPIRDAWSEAIAEHLDPAVEHLEYTQQIWQHVELTAVRPATWGTFGVMVDDGGGLLMEHGCRLIVWRWAEKRSGCRQRRLSGPHGEDAWVMQMPVDVSPRPTVNPSALVMVERVNGTFGYLEGYWFGGPDANPLPLDVMVEAAADPRLRLPAKAFGVPRNSTVAAVVHDHVGSFRTDLVRVSELGIGEVKTPGDFPWLSVRVVPAGRIPTCGARSLRSCVARQVYGADDPTTVYVGKWRTFMQFVYVGPKNTVSVYYADRARGANLQRRMIDLLLDPRLQ